MTIRPRWRGSLRFSVRGLALAARLLAWFLAWLLALDGGGLGGRDFRGCGLDGRLLAPCDLLELVAGLEGLGGLDRRFLGGVRRPLLRGRVVAGRLLLLLLLSLLRLALLPCSRHLVPFPGG